MMEQKNKTKDTDCKVEDLQEKVKSLFLKLNNYIQGNGNSLDLKRKSKLLTEEVFKTNNSNQSK